jgi:general secretion pathway protein D
VVNATQPAAAAPAVPIAPVVPAATAAPNPPVVPAAATVPNTPDSAAASNRFFQSPGRTRANRPEATNRPPISVPQRVDRVPPSPGLIATNAAPAAATPQAQAPAPAAAPAVPAAPSKPPAFPTFPPPEEEPEPEPPPGGAPPATPGKPPLLSGPAAGGTNAAAEKATITSAMLQLNNMPLDQAFELYSELVGKTVLKHPNVPPTGTITLKLNKQMAYTPTEAKQAIDTVLALNSITMIPMGEKFILAVPSQMALQEAAAFNTNSTSQLPEAAQYITEIVKLTNALPSELVPTIQPFAKMQGGIAAIDSSQILVIRDYAINVKRMLELIRKIDVATEPDYKLEVIPIKYGKVEDIYGVMSGLIGGGGGGSTSGTPTSSARRGGSSGGSGGRRGVSSTSRNSRMGQTGTQVSGQNVAQPAAGAQNSFQQRLSQIVQKAAGGDNQILGDAKIIPDERANTLVVYANKQDMVTITNIVSKLDIMLAQVLIEAAIIDVTIGSSMNLGASLMQSPQSSGQWSTVGGSQNGATLLGATTNLSTGLPNGFSYYAKYGGDLDMAVTALAANNRGTVIQRPRIQTSHAMPASFFSGSTVPYLSSYGGGYGGYGSSGYGGYGGGYGSVQQLKVGVGLDVTPFITPDGLVVLEISQTIEEVGEWKSIAGSDVPTTNTREANSMVSVRDKETIILGGFIRAAKSKSYSGVPGLKDIPLLGNLFRSSSRNSSRSEMVVLLRPTVLNTPLDATQAAKDELNHLPGAKRAEEEFKAQELQLRNEYERQDAKAAKAAEAARKKAKKQEIE